VSCVHYPYDRYNTQVGAVVGAGSGALIGQAVGRNTESTLYGLAVGTVAGTLIGNMIDQNYQATREASYHKRLSQPARHRHPSQFYRYSPLIKRNY
jgi:outer membrane lipoprotein SlyB